MNMSSTRVKLIILIYASTGIRRSEGEISFQSTNGIIKVTYQRVYETGWKREERGVRDIPDIVIEFKRGKVLIIDAKNSDLSLGSSEHYNKDMERYMRLAGNEQTDFGLLIFSAGGRNDSYELVKEHQKILWRMLTPGEQEGLNQETVDEIVSLINNYCK